MIDSGLFNIFTCILSTTNGLSKIKGLFAVAKASSGDVSCLFPNPFTLVTTSRQPSWSSNNKSEASIRSEKKKNNSV